MKWNKQKTHKKCRIALIRLTVYLYFNTVYGIVLKQKQKQNFYKVTSQHTVLISATEENVNDNYFIKCLFISFSVSNHSDTPIMLKSLQWLFTNVNTSEN